MLHKCDAFKFFFSTKSLRVLTVMQYCLEVVAPDKVLLRQIGMPYP